MLLVDFWLERADEIVEGCEATNFNVACWSSTEPTWTKLGREGLEPLSDPHRNLSSVGEVLVVEYAEEHHTGVYFCNGTYKNGNSFNRTYLLYIGCKLCRYTASPGIKLVFIS